MWDVPGMCRCHHSQITPVQYDNQDNKNAGTRSLYKTDPKHTKHMNLHCDGDIQTFSHSLTTSQTMCDLQCDSNGL